MLPNLMQACVRAVLPCVSASSGLAPAASSAVTMPAKPCSLAAISAVRPRPSRASRSAPLAMCSATSSAEPACAAANSQYLASS